MSETKHSVECTGCGCTLKDAYYLCTQQNYPKERDTPYCTECFEQRHAKGIFKTVSYFECGKYPTHSTGLQTPIDESYTAIPPLALHEMAKHWWHWYTYHSVEMIKEYHRSSCSHTDEAIHHMTSCGIIGNNQQVSTLTVSTYFALLALETEIVGQHNVKMTSAVDFVKGSDHPYSYAIIPNHALQQVARVMAVGTRKYGVRNWDKISVSDHLDHAIRHGYLYIMGDTTDEPDGITHLAHMACRALFALEVEMLKQQEMTKE